MPVAIRANNPWLSTNTRMEEIRPRITSSGINTIQGSSSQGEPSAAPANNAKLAKTNGTYKQSAMSSAK